MIVGITNLWAQSGMKARDAALLSALLVPYDFIATSQLPLMSDLVTRLSGLSLTPTISWSTETMVPGIGLGDVLLATVFPLVMRKAFGQLAGITALVLALVAIAMLPVLLAAIESLPVLHLQGLFPAMVVLGPLMVLQYLFWSRQRGQERTMFQYLQQEPLRPHRQSLSP
jgi:ABC-type branched-subunit amino acid transport system permease subunit